MQMTIGNGTVFMCSVTDENGREGVLLRQSDQQHEIDSIDPEWEDGKPYTPTEQDVVIWLENLQGARVLQDRINIACLKLNGFKVDDQSGERIRVEQGRRNGAVRNAITGTTAVSSSARTRCYTAFTTTGGKHEQQFLARRL